MKILEINKSRTVRIPFVIFEYFCKIISKKKKMSILSITFHTVESQLQTWEQYLENELITLVENFIDVEKYILSEVNTEMLTEGKNTNLLLIFESDEKRQEFTETELYNLSEIIARKFGESVMIYKTELNEKKSRF